MATIVPTTNTTSIYFEDFNFNFNKLLSNASMDNKLLSNASMDIYWRVSWFRRVLFIPVFVPIYIVIFLVGICGNSLIIYVVIKNRDMRTVINMFIANLALSDMYLCLISVPFTPTTYYLHSWIFGSALCHSLLMSLSLCIYASTMTCIGIAGVRYYAIVYPLKPRMSVNVCLIIIACIWATATVMSLPLGIFSEVKEVWNRKRCVENWPTSGVRALFSIISSFLQYILPCSIIACLYYKVFAALKADGVFRAGVLGAQCADRGAAERRRSRKTNKMLIWTTVIFVLCWLPFNTQMVVFDYIQFATSEDQLVSIEVYEVVSFISHSIAMSSTMYNPFLYAYMNMNFRRAFKRVLCCGS